MTNAGHRAARRPGWFAQENAKPLIAASLAVIAGLTVMRGVFAAIVPLRVDEAYYWTWSKESVLSFLDHPPMVSWCVYFGTLIFGDTNFGVRFSGLLAMLTIEVLLADIVWRTTRDWRCVIFAVLLPEATIDYGLLMTRIGPDTALTVFALAMAWHWYGLRCREIRAGGCWPASLAGWRCGRNTSSCCWCRRSLRLPWCPRGESSSLRAHIHGLRH